MSVVDSTLDMNEFDLKRQLISARLELKHPSFWRAVAAEFIGTFFFQLAGGLTAFNFGGQPTSIDNAAVVLSSLGAGFGLIAVLGIVGHISGHVNPAVSWGMCITKQISICRCILYICAQLLGSVSCALLLHFLTPNHLDGGMAVDFRILGAFTVHGTSQAYKAFLLELLSTWMFMMVIFGCQVDNKGATNLTPLIIGFAFTANVAAIAPYTGAALNPARAFGPAVAYQSFINHWVYWAGPLVGATLGALTYTHILYPYEEAFVTHLASFDQRQIEMLLPKQSKVSLPVNLPLAKPHRTPSRQMVGAQIDSTNTKSVHENWNYEDSNHLGWKGDSRDV